MYKSEILWNEEEYKQLIKKNFGDLSYGSDHLNDPYEYPCIFVYHAEYDNNYITKYRRGMEHYYGEWVSLRDFFHEKDNRILDCIQDNIKELYEESDD